MITVKLFLESGAEADGAVLAKWLVGPGDIVSAGDPIAEIELEKANMEIASAFTGRVHEMLVAEGDEVAIGSPIMKIKLE
jgi:pyruvate/2-oxoglutarate dehydrogenase complex dihydrolipoamide acyltransferase (E2) component